MHWPRLCAFDKQRPFAIFVAMKFISALFLSISLAAAVSAGNPTLDIQLKDIDGKKTSLKAHKGKVMLVVNVAANTSSLRISNS